MISDRNFDQEILLDFFRRNDNQFVPSLEAQINKSGNGNLKQYVEKLCDRATISYELDDLGKLMGVVIGYTHDLPAGTNASYITYVIVDSEYRGNGVCGRLIREYEEYCKLCGIRSMWMTTRKENKAAQRAYEKAGFRARESSDATIKYEKVL